MKILVVTFALILITSCFACGEKSTDTTTTTDSTEETSEVSG